MRTETAEIIQLPPAPSRESAGKKPPAKIKSNGRRWSPAQRKKFRATFARKKALRLKEERAERRTARTGGNDKGRAREERRAAIEAVGLTHTLPLPRKRAAGAEERLDAIVYLARAYAAYEHVSDEALLGLLALRTLQGRIK